MATQRFKLLLLMTLAASPVPASSTTILGPNLQDVAVYSYTAVTAGAAAQIFGNLMSGGVATAGAGSAVYGNYTSGGAAVVGAGGVTIGGDIRAGGAVTVGAGTTVRGRIITGAAATIGASSMIDGDVIAAAAVTAGALSKVAGNVQAGAAATIGAGARVDGTVGAVAAITQGAGSQIGGTLALSTPPVDGIDLAASIAAQIDSMCGEVVAAQATFAAMATTGFLDPLLTADTTLLPGVYSASSLTTTAGTTLTLDGQGMVGQFWIFNIADSLTTGANTHIILVGGADADSIIWNTGSYTSLGADSKLLGTLLSGGYVSIGANTQVTGLGSTCGGVFSALSYVTAAAGATVGAVGCSGIDAGYASGITTNPGSGAVPEPSIWALMLAGFAAIGAVMRRSRWPTVA